MTSVFISYRREDSEGYAVWIFDVLLDQLGPDNVFMDRTTIPPGAPYPQVLQTQLESCDALLALIGPRWLKAQDARGIRRIDDPQDWVTQEIGRALQRNILVIPLLVGDASLPSVAELPESLQALATAQAWPLPAESFRQRVKELAARLRDDIDRRRRELARQERAERLRNSRSAPMRRFQYPIWVLFFSGVLGASAVISASSAPTYLQAWAHLSAGHRAVAAKDLDGAISQFKEVLELAPSSKDAKLAMAKALFLKGPRFDQEACSYLRAISNISTRDWADMKPYIYRCTQMENRKGQAPQ
jgi:hypothetical protein